MIDSENHSSEVIRMVVNPNDEITVDVSEIAELGAAPRASSAKSWPSGKPPGDKLPTEANPQAKSTDKPK